MHAIQHCVLLLILKKQVINGDYNKASAFDQRYTYRLALHVSKPFYILNAFKFKKKIYIYIYIASWGSMADPL